MANMMSRVASKMFPGNAKLAAGTVICRNQYSDSPQQRLRGKIQIAVCEAGLVLIVFVNMLPGLECAKILACWGQH